VDAALASLDLATLQQRLAEALDALHRWATGDGEVSVDMDGVRTTYSEVNQKRLEGYVNQLQAAIRAKERGTTGRGPLYPGRVGRL